MSTQLISINGQISENKNLSYLLHKIESGFRISLFKNDRCFYGSRTMSLKEASELVTNWRYTRKSFSNNGVCVIKSAI